MLSESVIKEVLDVALSTSGDFAELFLEDRQDQNLMMIGHRVEKANGGRTYGAGFRIFSGNNTICGYTNDTSKANQIKVAKDIGASIGSVDKNLGIELDKNCLMVLHPIHKMPTEVPKKDKVDGMKLAKGKITEPVDQITAAGNFKNLLLDIVAVGKDLVFTLPQGHTFIASPSLKVKGLAVSGQ